MEMCLFFFFVLKVKYKHMARCSVPNVHALKMISGAEGRKLWVDSFLELCFNSRGSHMVSRCTRTTGFVDLFFFCFI